MPKKIIFLFLIFLFLSSCSFDDLLGGGGSSSSTNTAITKQAYVWYKDFDGDGYSDGNHVENSETSATYYKLASDLISTSGDCNDLNASIHPGMKENCNTSYDDDCNIATICQKYYEDSDHDYWKNSNTYVVALDPPSTQHIPESKLKGLVLDCNPSDSAINPGATEICGNNIDEDCNAFTVCYAKDSDKDGYIDKNSKWKIASKSFSEDGYFSQTYSGLKSLVFNDCNDEDATINIAGIETFNGKDDDCNSATCAYAKDQDNDGHYDKTYNVVIKNPASVTEKWLISEFIDGALYKPFDDVCDEDANCIRGINEICGNGIDDDHEPNTTCLYLDNDNDCSLVTNAQGNPIGTAFNIALMATIPSNYIIETNRDGKSILSSSHCPSITKGDCDDNDPLRSPAIAEYCDSGRKDNDCNSNSFCYYIDKDRDGYASSTISQTGSLSPTIGGVSEADTNGALYYSRFIAKADCDDNNVLRSPGLAEYCDSETQDNDCNSSSFCYYIDKDQDGYPSGTIAQTGSSPLKSVSEGATNGTLYYNRFIAKADCDDNNVLISPGLAEYCDSKAQDNDCNSNSFCYYIDEDKDGYAASTSVATGSTPAHGISEGISTGTITGTLYYNRFIAKVDCDDKNKLVYPGAQEIFDKIDTDCNPSTVFYFIDGDDDNYAKQEGEIKQLSGSSTSYLTDPKYEGYTNSTYYNNWKNGIYDCADDKNYINPSMAEKCDLYEGKDIVDNDCNSKTKCYYIDQDKDRYAKISKGEVTKTNEPIPSGACVEIAMTAGSCTNTLVNIRKGSSLKDDCNDTVASINPGASEACNGNDDNCDGAYMVYLDRDGDGYLHGTGLSNSVSGVLKYLSETYQNIDSKYASKGKFCQTITTFVLDCLDTDNSKTNNPEVDGCTDNAFGKGFGFGCSGIPPLKY